MKLIYYSTAYYASHGGGNQSILFFKEALRSSYVDQLLIFPKKGKEGILSKGSLRSRVRSSLRKIGLLQVLFFYRRNKFYLKELSEMIHNEKPDAILIQTDSSFLQVRYLKEKFPSLIVSTVVNSSPFDEPFYNIAFKPYFRTLESKCLSSADVNFFVSGWLRERIMANTLNKQRDYVIHNGVDTSVFCPVEGRPSIKDKNGIPSDRFIIGYVGTLDKHKRIDLLIDAFHILRGRGSDPYLVIVGSGPHLELARERIDSLSLASNVMLTGWLDHAKIPEMLNCFDLAVHHYANDYMSPLKIFEYLATGLPVLGPAIPGVLEVFKDHEHLVLTKGDPRDIANKIEMLINDKQLRDKIAKSGRSLILEKYTWQQNADFILDRIKYCLEK